VRIRFLADAHFPRAATEGLRRRGVDIIMAQEDGSDRLDDLALLRRATSMGRILVTQDADLLREGSLLQQAGEPFAGIVYGHQMRVSIGDLVVDLALIADTTTSEAWLCRIGYLPIKRPQSA
jgi:hypothetical protein